MDNLTYLIAHAPTAPNWFHPAGYDKKPYYGEMLANDIQKQDAMSICNEYDFKLDIEWRIYWARSVLLQLEGEGIVAGVKKDEPRGDGGVMYRIYIKKSNGDWRPWSLPFASNLEAQELFAKACMEHPKCEFKIATEEVSDE